MREFSIFGNFGHLDQFWGEVVTHWGPGEAFFDIFPLPPIIPRVPYHGQFNLSIASDSGTPQWHGLFLNFLITSPSPHTEWRHSAGGETCIMGTQAAFTRLLCLMLCSSFVLQHLLV